MTTIKIKNSSTLNKVPTTGDLETAELALNLANKVLYTKDAGGNVFKLAGSTQSGATADRPAAPNTGEFFYDTDEEDFYYFDGTTWHPLTDETGGVIISPTPPIDPAPEPGALWFDPESAQLYVYYEDSDSSQWVPSTPTDTDPGHAHVWMTTSPPADAELGHLWYDLDSGRMFVYTTNSAVQPVWVQHI